MKCKDIPDLTLQQVVLLTPKRPHITLWRHKDDVRAKLEEMIGRPIPERLFLAKIRKLVKRRVICGCACGCRGDFYLPFEDKR